VGQSSGNTETILVSWAELCPEVYVSEYDVSSIQVLEGVEAVRKRPGMYVGSTGPMGVVHLVFELVSNSVQEHLAGHAQALSLQTGRGGITVSDDGRGLPPEAFVLFTNVFGGPYHPDVHLAEFGLGLGVVNALSSVLVATIDRDQRYQQVFARGRPVTELLALGPAVGRGTTLHLTPDPAIFEPPTLPMKVLRRRLEELAVLNPGLSITLDGWQVPSHGGLMGLARVLAGGTVRAELWEEGTFGDVDLQLAVVWGEGECVVRGWVHQLECEGAHVRGLLDGLRGTDERGRVALLAVKLPHAEFVGRTGRKLVGDHVRGVVHEVVLAARERMRL
jgi:DNA gyrase subunit B